MAIVKQWLKKSEKMRKVLKKKQIEIKLKKNSNRREGGMTGDRDKQSPNQRGFTFFGETGETAVVRSKHFSVSAPGSTEVLTKNEASTEVLTKNEASTEVLTTNDGSTEVLTTNDPSAFPLATAKVGDRLWIFGLSGKGGMSRLLGMGLAPGTAIEVISSTGTGSVIVAFGDNRIGLGAGMAEKILVTKTKIEAKPMAENGGKHLRDIPVGGKGRVVGYEKAARAYKGKLLAMGLTPKTEFTVVRQAPMGDPVEIKVRGFHLSLRKEEANALCVEEEEKTND